MRRSTFVLASLVVLAIGACGGETGDDATGAESDGGGDSTAVSDGDGDDSGEGSGGSDDAGSSGNADFPPAADPGTGFLEIDGQTYVGVTNACDIDSDDASFSVEVDGNPVVTIGGLVFDARSGEVNVSFDFDPKYASNAGPGYFNELNASVAVEGSTLFWSGTFVVVDENYMETGETVQGRVSVTC